MHEIEEYYFKINRIVLKTLGLWPYQKSYLVQIQNILFIGILLTFLIVQLLAFITIRYSMSNICKIFSFVFPTIFVMIKYCLFIIQADSVRQLLEQIRNDWNLLKNNLEIDIVKKYACNARFFTFFTMVFCYCGIFMCAILQFLPMILDVVSPLNESRPCPLIVVTEYFVNQEKYFYPLLMHEVLTGCIGATALCFTGTTIMTYMQHACALFKIASYRIENAIEKSTLAIPNPKKEYLLYQKIVHAVVIHQRAIEFIEFIASSFMVSYIILIIIGVISLSFNLFQFLQVITLTNDIHEALIVAIMIITHLMYMYIINYGGQEIMEHGIKLFKATYNGLWYAAPLQTQKLLLFMMQKGTKNVFLTCNGLFIMSLEGFATLLSTAISYFTVMYSTR